MALEDQATKAEAVAAAVKTRTGEKRKATFRQVRSIPLEYGEEVTERLPVPLAVLGIYAQREAGGSEAGKISRKAARYIDPQLVYLYDAAKKQEELTILLLRGHAELPLDGKTYDFLGLAEDRNPQHNCFASAWLVSEKKG